MSVTTVKERPILFSGEMVRAILDGRKTQTRRVMKVQPNAGQKFRYVDGRVWVTLGEQEYDPHTKKTIYGGEARLGNDALFYSPIVVGKGPRGEGNPLVCPYGEVGQTLWVREAFSAWFHGHHWYDSLKGYRTYAVCTNRFWRATHHFPDDDQRWVPGIFMPRWASRLTLEITDVRVERLNDISEADAIAEGCTETRWDSHGRTISNSAKCNYRTLWDSINGKAHPWVSNPWVWVVAFRKL